jgi:hypothetical protein
MLALILSFFCVETGSFDYFGTTLAKVACFYDAGLMRLPSHD